MKELSLKEKTAKGLFWGGISNGLQQLLNLVFGIVLARVLDASDYGMIGMLAVFSGIASTVQESGFTNALTNKKHITSDDYNAVFWFSVISGVAFYIILFITAPLIASFYNKPDLTLLSRILFLAFVFNGFGVAQYAFLFKNLMAKEQAKVGIFSLLLSGSVGIVFALKGYSYWGLAFQSVVYAFSSTLLRWHYTPWKPAFKVNFNPLKPMIRFSSRLLFTRIFHQINSNIFSVLLGRFYDVKQVGFYVQGQKWMGMGNTFLAGMINTVAQPILTQLTEDKNRQQNAFRKILRFGSFISFPAMFGLAFVGHEFIYITIGEKWQQSVPYLQLLCIWGGFIFISELYMNLLLAYGKSNIYMWSVIITGCLQLCSVGLMFSYGIFAMIITYIGVSFISLLAQTFFIKRLISFNFYQMAKDIIPYFLATFFSFLLAWLFTMNISNQYLLLFLKISISAFFYILILWLGKSIILKDVILYFRNLFEA